MIRPRTTGLAPLLALLCLHSCNRTESGHFQGYVEGEFVYVASSLGGDLEQLDVQRGQRVAIGEELFRLEATPEVLQLEETRQRMAQAGARLSDLEKGERPSELARIEARLGQARSALELAQREYERRRALFAAGDSDAVSEEELDRFDTQREVADFEVRSLEAELETARLGGRVDAVAGAEGEVKALAAALARLEWQLGEKTVSSPAEALVQDTLYRVGEYVAPGRPVVSLLPPANLKVRFFVPQEILPSIERGDPVQVHLDGVAQRLRASISFISPEAEFTPPVIYSKSSRSKLVFMVEARPDAEALGRLHPGQPLEVYLD